MGRSASESGSNGSRFRRSVNIEYDRQASTPLDGYFPTGCARRTLSRILEALCGTSSSRAWTLTGPYGSGKSAFSVFLTHLLANRAPAGKQAAELVRQTDAALYKEFESTLGRGSVVPIVVTGAREPLATALTRGLSHALTALDTLRTRRLNTHLLKDTTPSASASIGWVKKCLEAFATEQSAFKGAVLVIDELGKLLEFAAANPARSDVYLLQLLAEYAARSEHRLLFLGVLHQDFSGYARELSPEERREWEKVRGRFEDIAFEESADDLLRLLARAWAEVRADTTFPKVRIDATIRELSERPWDLGLAPSSLSRERGAKLLLECLPLHPATTLLLAPVFKRFGQNERSAFSFLAGHEPGGLKEFVRRNHGSELYSVVHLYDYLVATLGDSLLATRDGKRWAEVLDLERRFPHVSAVEAAVLRTVAFFGIVGRWNGITPTKDVIRFSLSPQFGTDQIEASLRSLESSSVIVHRRFNHSYALWEGSDIDIEAKLSAARSDLPADTPTDALLQSHYAPRPLVARHHSFETGTVRYFEVTYASLATLANHLSDKASPRSDGGIVVVLPGREGSLSSIPLNQAVQAHATREGVLLVLPGNVREIDTMARELASICWVRQRTPELANDSAARRELDGREAEVRRRLDDELAALLVPHPTRQARPAWFHCGEELQVGNLRELNGHLSRISDHLYDKCPRISNEIINRSDLSSSAAAARRTLIQRMIECGREECLGLTGNPPERSIYLSVLRAMGLHRQDGDNWTFVPVFAKLRADAKPFYKAIRGFFDSAHTTPRSIEELFALLKAPPFGLRDGVLPILFCATLLGNEADVALYEDSAFIPQLTVTVFERLMKEPSRYTVRRWRVSGVRAVVFRHLAGVLNQEHIGERIEQRDVLDVVKPLMRFVRKLDDFSRNTRSLSPTTVAIRDAICSASEPDQLLFRDLPLACGLQPFGSREKGREADAHRFPSVLRQSLAELQQAYENLLAHITESVGGVFDLDGDQARIRGRLQRRAGLVAEVALDPEIKVFVSRLADSKADVRAWAESVASFLAGKHPTLWSDDDRARFHVRLKQKASAFHALESLVIGRKGSEGYLPGIESIRVAIAGTAITQAEHVIHLDKDELKTVIALERACFATVRKHAQNGTRNLAVAALARLTHQLLSMGSLAETRK